MIKKSILALTSVSCLLLVGCASNPSMNANTSSTASSSKVSSTNGGVSDPFQTYNRSMFRFNTVVTDTIFVPVTKGYNWTVPAPGRNAIHNFFANIMTVPDIANDLLQGNFHYMFSDIARLLINTTIGVGGLFDVAAQNHIYAHQQSFGYTLARWGWTDSPYFVIPLLGPSTVSNAIGLVPDGFMSPISYFDPVYVRYSLVGLGTLQTASEVVPKQQALAAISLDPYVALRNAYLQNQAHVMQQIDNDGYVPPTMEQPHIDIGTDINTPNTPAEHTVPAVTSQGRGAPISTVQSAKKTTPSSPVATSAVASPATALTSAPTASASPQVPPPVATASVSGQTKAAASAAKVPATIPATTVAPQPVPIIQLAPVSSTMTPPPQSATAVKEQAQVEGDANQALQSTSRLGVSGEVSNPSSISAS